MVDSSSSRPSNPTNPQDAGPSQPSVGKLPLLPTAYTVWLTSHNVARRSSEKRHHKIEDLTSSIDYLNLESMNPFPHGNTDGPPTPPETTMSSSESISSTEINDQLTPLPKNMTNSDRPSLLRRNSSSPRMSPQPNFSSPTLPSLSELLVSPPLPDDYDRAQSYFPPFPKNGSSSKSQLDYADLAGTTESSTSLPHTPSDGGLPIKALSDSGTYALIRRASKERSPRIRNQGGVLAPHGSFTTSRNRSSTINSNSSRSSLNTTTSITPQESPQEMSAQEREKLFKAAAKGDQLAMHRLGWRPVRPNHRHTLGSAEDIWGAMYSPTSTTRRSSNASQASLTGQPSDQPPSPANIDSPTTTHQRSYTQSDLFSDAVNLTLRSNALTNNRNPFPQTTNSTVRVPRKPPRKDSV
ncbi:uncharacterized protein I206_105472 [Kwoniella pini CBS 10737]|uniref:Uncharacterized protein n=1 Tax=Kwoniella pini CBS 10737 TaxID=1296096 RepID=A0A1B9I452_9TREE|nr:uncharacterized protein I206_03624 [Kwoniella pini CBS 10737]OCF50305.1 hypothetical protein I206_03624 [Kwoniella pini CBS 10737]